MTNLIFKTLSYDNSELSSCNSHLFKDGSVTHWGTKNKSYSLLEKSFLYIKVIELFSETSTLQVKNTTVLFCYSSSLFSI